MPNPDSRRMLRRGLIAAAVILVVAGAVVAYVLSHAPGNVSHPNVQFTQPTTTTTAPAPAPRKQAAPDNFVWPWYGFDDGRTRFFDAPADLHPPLRVGWKFFDGALLEFPPVIYHRTLYLLDDDGSARSIRISNGQVNWVRKIGTLSASSPVVDAADQLVLMPVLSVSGHSPGNGRFVALSMRDGHIVWSRPDGPGSETSPIIGGHTVYYGDQSGTLFARDARTGHLDWTFHASGSIKGGPALVDGILYFGDYSGRAYAVRALDGKAVWSVGTNGTHFGFGSGNFYSTPAVAYGRVYMGSTDGRVYSFAQRNGALAWATATGAYVYSAPAVADPRGLGPTVYIGSYDGNLYAFNAQSGAVRWKHYVGGRISGSVTALSNVVYFSDLGHRQTFGLDAVTGRQVFGFPDGAFTPIIADYHALYLSGYLTLYQLLPEPPGRPAAHAARSHGPHRPPPRHRPTPKKAARQGGHKK